MQLWGRTKVGYTPTLGVAYGGLGGENYWYAQDRRCGRRSRCAASCRAFAFEPRSRRRTMAADNDWNHIRAATLAKQLLDAGVSVQLGAHGQREGLAAHWELWMLAQGGMTPLEALRAGTLAGASTSAWTGTSARSRSASSPTWRSSTSDPRTDIRATRQVAMVMRARRASPGPLGASPCW
jgi:hypothetical protein